METPIYNPRFKPFRAFHEEPVRKKVIRMAPTKEMYDYYTDVLSHHFNPFDSHQAIVGTTFGEIVIIADDTKDRNSFQPEPLDRVRLPNSSPVTSIDWGGSANEVFIGSKRWMYFLDVGVVASRNIDEKPLDLKRVPLVPQAIYKSNFSDIMDITFLPHSQNRICVACDDGSSRIYDIVAEKTICELRKHKGTVEVCDAKMDWLVTGGADGLVHLYDISLRTNKPIGEFDNGNLPVNNLAISKDAHWLAVAGADSSDIPTVYNINTKLNVSISKESSGDTGKIYALTFDTHGALYWGGPDGTIYKSDDLVTESGNMKTRYGDGEIRQVFSIATGEVNGKMRLSAAGSTNCVLFSENADYWDTMVHI